MSLNFGIGELRLSPSKGENVMQSWIKVTALVRNRRFSLYFRT